MLRLIGIIVVMLAGLALGLGITQWMLSRAVTIGALQSGPWVANVRAADDPDPYTLAREARTGRVGLALVEGLRFIARVDDAGQALRGSCEYRISGAVPQNRYWTLTIGNRDALAVRTRFMRDVITSSELLRDAESGWIITLNAQARPGNWLPLPPDDPFSLILHLYEPSILGGTAAIDREQLPHIERGTCE